MLGKPAEFGVARKSVAIFKPTGSKRLIGTLVVDKGLAQAGGRIRRGWVVKLAVLALTVLQAGEITREEGGRNKVSAVVDPTLYLLDSQLKRKKVLSLPL